MAPEPEHERNHGPEPRRRSSLGSSRALPVAPSLALTVALTIAASPAALRAEMISYGGITIAEGQTTGMWLGSEVATAGDVNGDGYSDVLVASTQGMGQVHCYYGGPDPAALNLNWISTSDQLGSQYGRAVAAAGDVNGDGYGDVLVGAHNYDLGQNDEGCVFVYLGSPSGLLVTPQRILESDQASARFGYDVSTAGDVNGDGYDDILVGAPEWESSIGQNSEGRAYVYLGSASGVAATPAWTFENNQVESILGWSVSDAGDMNGDGYADIVVAAPYFSNGSQKEGRLYLFPGSASGPSASPTWTWEPNLDWADAGYGLGCAGDLNADGYTDIVASQYHQPTATGSVVVHFGAASGPDGTVDRVLSGGGYYYGRDAFTGGDVNGDGCADLVISDYMANSSQGSVWVYAGSETGTTLQVGATRTGFNTPQYLGYSATCAGDVNGDGFGDVVIGAPTWDGPAVDSGRAVLYLGGGSLPGSTPSWSFPSIQLDGYFGTSVAQGDWNGDGYDDIAIGDPYNDWVGTNAGSVTLFYGKETGYTGASWWLYGPSAGARFGWSVANAGDTDNDGYDDLIVGAPYKANGSWTEIGAAYLYRGGPGQVDNVADWSFGGTTWADHIGWSVAGAGDVNGDGYADVIIGAPEFAHFGGAQGGVAWIFAGSPTGPGVSSWWWGQGGTSGDKYGYCVTSVGDANGDGYSDFAVGAPYKESGESDEGFVYVYYGGETGATGSWSTQMNRTNSKFGACLVSAGDVNADGYSDLLVGAPGYDTAGATDRGYAVLYPGTASGISISALWANQGLVGADLYGNALASGDLNRDGHSDFAVGAQLQDTGGINRGAVYIYLGDSPVPWSDPEWVEYGTQDQAQFGGAISMDGDFTGDGLPDVVIGEPLFQAINQRGNAHIYYGGRAAMPTTDLGVHRLPRQFRQDGITPVMNGGRNDSHLSLRISAIGRSAYGRATLRAQYQVDESGDTWDTPPVAGNLFDTGAPTAGVGSAQQVSIPVTELEPETPYHWRVRFKGTSPYFPHTSWLTASTNAGTETDVRTGIFDVSDAPDDALDSPAQGLGRLRFSRVAPNPVSADAASSDADLHLEFIAPQATDVQLTVHDVTGRTIATLLDGPVPAGSNRITWAAGERRRHSLAPGVYFVRLSQEGQVAKRKLVITH